MGTNNPFCKASELVAISIHLRRRQKRYIAYGEDYNPDRASVYNFT